MARHRKRLKNIAKDKYKKGKLKRVTFRKLGDMGRLGNQMFQIAATIGVAKKHSAKYFFRRWRYSQYFENPVPTRPFINLRPWSNYYQPNYSSSKISPGLVSLSLVGYFQSEIYFKHCENDIRNYFTLKNKWVEYIKNKYPQLQGDTCSIHVRRGDYIAKPDCHPIQTLSYYENAAKELYGTNLNNINFIICSDDIEWCKKNFKFSKMTFIEGEVDIIDMFIMSMCGDNIIANSSFSWWSAWLNQNQNRVVAPNNWYGPKIPYDSKDLYIDDWIRL